MNFHELLTKMQELDRPVEECGEPMNMPAPAMQTPPTTPPSMSVNLNAQGMDNIEDLLKLITKVNPDTIKSDPTLPSLTPPGPSIASIKPELPPLKMLPDFDKPGDDKMNPPGLPGLGGGGDEPKVIDIDIDGDKEKEGPGPDGSPEHEGPEGEKPEPEEMDDKEEKDDDEDKEDEAFGNSVGSSEPETKDASFSTHDGNDLNKSKGTYPKVAGGDNPMQKQKFEGDLRSQIRAELMQRLAEAKGAK
jgi:hypothetical protein